MIFLFALLILVAVLGLIAAWIGANPGTVTMLWFGYQIETSVAILMLFAILASMLLTFAYNMVKKIFMAPKRYSERRSVKQYRIAIAEVTHSIAALAASDIPVAARHARKAEKALGTTPLTLLLRAQISKSAGSDEESRELLEQLLEHPETEYLAAKSLADVAVKRDMLPQAMTLAQRAHKTNPRARGGAWSVFNLHLDAGNFQEAEIHARQAQKNGALSFADMREAKGRIALRQAQNSYTNGNKENALVLAQKAVKCLHGDVKAAELCAKLYAETSQPKKALSLIQTQWIIAASPELARVFLQVTEHEKPEKRRKLIEKLIASNESAPENVDLQAA